jgi:3-oxoacyl-[acyl-carrier protein] reductase
VQPWLVSYAVSKAALDMLVRSAAIELAPHLIRVNSVQPGWVRTDEKDPMTVAAMEPARRATPLGGPGSPKDVGRAVAFLASDQAAWITGQTLGVDGGLNVPVLPGVAGVAALAYGQDVVDQIALPDLAAPRESTSSGEVAR